MRDQRNEAGDGNVLGSGSGSGKRSIAEILRPILEARAVAVGSDEGLRDRKKRLLRQQISDTATGMFLERGFDAVRVSEIAQACDVSEKTVFNYFPTKESLLFDREDDLADQIDAALRTPRPGVSLTDAAMAIIEQEVNGVYDSWARADDAANAFRIINAFNELVQSTPALLNAMNGMMERLTQVAAGALADRAGVDVDDPEPQMAATILTSLWRAEFRAMQRHAMSGVDVDAVRAAVLSDIRRAARVADSGLSTFNLVVDPPVRAGTNKEQLLAAAEATNEARRQVMAAVKQARTAWKQMVNEAHLAQDHEGDPQRSHREMRARQQEMREQIHRYKHELREQQMAEWQARHQRRR